MSAISKIKVGGTTYDLARPLDTYPVGSIYLSVNDTSPAELFGGTWEQLKDRFLLAAGDTYAVGNSGGSASHSHTLSENGAACIGNYDNTTAFYSPNRYAWKDHPKRHAMYTWTHNSNTQFNPSTSYHDNGYFVSLIGSTDMANSMPPYLAVYMWKRIA